VAESYKNILVMQTAFIGDAILTLPLLQILRQHYSQSAIDVVVIPRTAELFANHPAISHIFQFDKRGKDKGVNGLRRLLKNLASHKYELVIVPHRSLRSALITWLLKPGLSIGFDRSAGHWLFKKKVHYNPSLHEIERNLALLQPLGISPATGELPRLYPSDQDVHLIDSIEHVNGLNKFSALVAIAPGTVWNTKRWPADRFAAVCKQIESEQVAVVLLGGKEDELLCRQIQEISRAKNCFMLAGKLSLLQSAELLRRCQALISNDSAPMHLAVAMGIPVIAIFGATVPEFGFAPRGKYDIVLETKGLSCRPCSIHGGNVCPIKTFECMLSITPETALNAWKSIKSTRT
jgi:heptosyltransferase II